MKYTPSINIAQTAFNPKSYIVTQNAKGVVGNIVDSFNAGVHSFNIIGSYGTSFTAASPPLPRAASGCSAGSPAPSAR